MKEIIIIEKGSDGTFSAYPSSIKDTIIGEGNTAEEAKSDFLNSYEELIQFYKEEGRVPEYLENIEFEYTYDLSAFFSYFKFINVSKFAEAIGIEPSLMRHYKIGDARISREQAKRIENGIHVLASELQKVTL